MLFAAAGCGGHARARGTIVFESDRSGREALYAVRPDGGGPAKLRDLPSAESSVFWTRDGTKALLFDYRPFASVFEAGGKTRTIRLAGFDPASEAPWSDMHWSPDGKRLAYPTDNGIVVLDVASGTRRRVASGASDGAVAWSPDGKRLLFVDWSDDSVSVAPAGGGRRTRLARLPADVSPDALPEWSADGSWISLLSFGPQNLYVLRADGTHLHAVARNVEGAAWSPSGARLAFAAGTGIVVLDAASARRRQLTRDPLDANPAWSPDGRRIVYARNDLGRHARDDRHAQLWTMNADGTDRRAVTHAFPDDGSNGPAVWVAPTLKGAPPPRLPLVSLRGTHAIGTQWPIVALAVDGGRAAVAQGLGPLGPIVVWDPARGTVSRTPIPRCGKAASVTLDAVIFVAGRVGYGCEDSGVAYSADDTLRLVQPARGAIVRTHADEFSGSLLGGVAGDGNALAFDVDAVRPARSRIWTVTRRGKTIVRTFAGEATVTSLDRGRIAVVRDGKAVSVLSPGGGIRTFAFRGRVLGAALDGSQLVVLQAARVVVLDLASGGRTAAWPVRRGFGPAPELEDARGDLAVYAVGTALHVLRLADGREFVVDLPSATEPVFARFAPSGLFYSFDESYAERPGRLVFVKRAELERALASP